MKDIVPMYDSDITDLPLFNKGKVRDIYDISELMKLPALLIITTDRISAFDRVMKEPIPLKGYVLNQMTLFWSEYFSQYMPFKSHLVTADIGEYPQELQKYRDKLEGRSMIVKKHKVIPIECVVRGYLFGSAKKDYDRTGKVGWHKLTSGLVEASKLSESIFTPSTKAKEGEHDENIDSRENAAIILENFFSEDSLKESGLSALDILDLIEHFSINLYQDATKYAEGKGIIIADTKEEIAFPWEDPHIVLCDEYLTPDSSRFWPLSSYEPGKPQSSLDKQYVRDYLSSIDFTGEGSIPNLPDDVIMETSRIYVEIFRLLTERKLQVP